MKTIALCSVGNLGKYFCDELLADGRYPFVVISRQSTKGSFFSDRGIDVRTSDYSTASVVQILNETNASTLISFNNCLDETFVTVHLAFLEACRRSQTCKRFIPSEFAGNIDDFPFLPSFFRTSRVPFRKVLEQETEIEYTVFNNGWLMDYFLPRGKSYMPSIPDEFPIDPNNWKACIRGSGDQVQSFTWGRDVARALVALLGAPRWERTTYITGQYATFNEMVEIMEDFYGRPMHKTYRSENDIRRDAALPATPENEQALYLASVEEMMVTGSGACPVEKTIRQKREFFGELEFVTLRELLMRMEGRGLERWGGEDR